MKVFKINLSVVYNDDEITADIICNNMFETIKAINDKCAILNIDNIKEINKPDQAIKRMMNDIMQEPFDNVKNGENYIEVDKTTKE